MSELFNNGLARTNTGYRQVLVSSQGELRPVMVRLNSGYVPQRRTMQVAPKPGDLMLRSDWNRSSIRYSIMQYSTQEEWVPVGDKEKFDLYIETEGYEEIKDESVTLWELAIKANPWIPEFLDPREKGRAVSMLPWEGDTLSEKAKRRRIKDFMATWGLEGEELEGELMRSPKEGLEFIPVRNDHVLDRIPVFNTWTGSVVGIHKKELWYGLRTGGIDLLDVIYEAEHGSNYAYEGKTSSEGKPLKDLPGITTYRQLLCLTKGAYSREHYSYGIKVEVFEL